MTDPEASTSNESPAPHGGVVATILERIEAGESVDLEGEIALHPDLAEVLREDLSSLVRGLRRLGIATSTPPPLPSRIGGYRVEWRIGQGGEGASVFRAVQETTGQVVALKVLPPNSDERRVQRFLLQRRFAALHHQHIVPVLDADESDGFHFLAMELMAGGSLASIVGALRRESTKTLQQLPRAIQERMGLLAGRVSTIPADRIRREAHVRWAVATVRDVALGLHQAHQEGVIHRDVKPSNILLTSEGSPRLADFGLARRVEASALTRSGETPGTRPYMSPEQVDSNAGLLDHRSDLYSLGATLYELLTLKRPLEVDSDDGLSDAELLDRIRYHRPADARRLNPAIPRDLGALVAKLLEKVPEDRFASAAELATQLQRFLDGAAMSVRPIRWPTRLLRRARRHPVVASMVVSSVGVLLLVIGFCAGILRESEKVQQTERSMRAQAHLERALTAFRELDFDEGHRAANIGTEELLKLLRDATDRDEADGRLREIAELAMARNDAMGAKAVLGRVTDRASSNPGAQRQLLDLRSRILLASDPAAAPDVLHELAVTSGTSTSKSASLSRQARLTAELALHHELYLPGVLDLSSAWWRVQVPFVARNGEVGLRRPDGTCHGWRRLPGQVRELIAKTDFVPTFLAVRRKGPSPDDGDGFQCLLQIRGSLFRFTFLPAGDAEIDADEVVLGEPGNFLRTRLTVLEADESGQPQRVYVATRTNHVPPPNTNGCIDFDVDFRRTPPIARPIPGTRSATHRVQQLSGAGGILALAMGEWSGFGILFMERSDDGLAATSMQRLGFVSSLEKAEASPGSRALYLLGKGSEYRSTSFFDTGGLREWPAGVYVTQLSGDSAPRMVQVAQDISVDDRVRWSVNVAPDVRVTQREDGDPVHLAVFSEAGIGKELRVYGRPPIPTPGHGPIAPLSMTPLLRMHTRLPSHVPLLSRDLDDDGDDEVFPGEAKWMGDSDKVLLTIVGMRRKP